jgi:hypothetical protein
MEIEEALVAYLLAKPGLTVLISSRLYPDEIPQSDPLPAVYYIDISDAKIHTLTGQSSLERPMKQFTVCAATKSSAKAVAKQLKIALVDYQGSMSGIEIQKIELQNELSNLEKSSDGTVRTFTHDLEFEINYVRSN